MTSVETEPSFLLLPQLWLHSQSILIRTLVSVSLVMLLFLATHLRLLWLCDRFKSRIVSTFLTVPLAVCRSASSSRVSSKYQNTRGRGSPEGETISAISKSTFHTVTPENYGVTHTVAQSTAGTGLLVGLPIGPMRVMQCRPGLS